VGWSWRPTCKGVSTYKVEDLVAALGAAKGYLYLGGVQDLSSAHTEMEAFRTRRLRTVEFPSLFADAT
jgi:transposase-like protein